MMERLLRSNNVVRLIAFFLAFTFWAFVTGDMGGTESQDITRRYPNVALEWINLTEDVDIIQIPEEIEITLSGRSAVLNNITPQTLRVFVDLKNLSPGQHRLTPTAIVPSGTRVLSYTPQQIQVTLEEVQSPQMPVTLDFMGRPAEGFITGEARITPGKVFLRGVRSNLEIVERVRAIINVDGADSNRSQMVPVHAIDSNGHVVEGITVNPSLVEVIIPVHRPLKEVPVRLQTSGEPATGYRIEQINLTPAQVIIEGPQTVLQSIEEILTVPVDIEGAQETVTINVELAESPEGATLHYKDQVQVEIIIVPL